MAGVLHGNIVIRAGDQLLPADRLYPGLALGQMVTFRRQGKNATEVAADHGKRGSHHVDRGSTRHVYLPDWLRR